MRYSWVQTSSASKPITGIEPMKFSSVSIPAALIPWLREAIRDEIRYWEEQNDTKQSRKKIAEYKALLKNLGGRS